MQIWVVIIKNNQITCFGGLNDKGIDFKVVLVGLGQSILLLIHCCIVASNGYSDHFC